ncbi:hypothetical protein BH10PSE14_BH10PSE14_19920 [soil metagenome]
MRWGRPAAIGLGLALAALTQWVAFVCAAFGEGWNTPFYYSLVLFILYPIVVLRLFGNTAVVPAAEIVLLAMAFLMDVAIVSATLSEGTQYFWHIEPFNWIWIALWSSWQVGALASMTLILTRQPSED